MDSGDIPSQRVPASEFVRTVLRDSETRDDILDKLENYVYVQCDDTDEPDIGSFVRYIDMRDFPPVLRPGGFVVDIEDTYVKLRAGKRFWSVLKHTTHFFQKKRERDYMLDAVASLFKT